MTRIFDEDLKVGFGTRAIHAGQRPDLLSGAIMTPIYTTSTYVQEGLGDNKGYEYARGKNPTREALERNVAALEGGVHGFAFSSGRCVFPPDWRRLGWMSSEATDEVLRQASPINSDVVSRIADSLADGNVIHALRSI